MSEPKSLKSQHPQTSGKNRLNNPPSRKTDTAPAVEASEPSSVTVPPKQPVPAPIAPVAPSPAVSTPKPPSEPGKERAYFELVVKINDSDAPPFTVEVSLTGNGANDKARAVAKAKTKFPGKAMTILSSRIYTKTDNALSEINPGSTLSMLFGTPGGLTEDLIEIGRAVHDGARGTIFLRNLRSHVGLTFRPASGGLVVFNNRIVSNRPASELPIIVAEILGNSAREIEINLKS